MNARIMAWLENLGDQFWLRPALVVLGCLVAAHLAVLADHAHLLGSEMMGASLLYTGGGEGARSLLSAVASSSISVASTIFSITIAALSLASGQMGPRLLRNFIRDSRNQVALGIFLGTFAYALIVLRTVRTAQEDPFVPNIAVTGALVLALVCIGTLTWFVHHIATSINVERVVDTVHRDLVHSIGLHTHETPGPAAPAERLVGRPIVADGSDYVQAVDAEGLADWAQSNDLVVALRVRPGDYVPCGAPVAVVSREADGVDAAVSRALTFGRKPAALQDLEYSVRQLNEIAVRALSPGINDPFTAGSVLERFGDALCRLAPRHLPTGTILRDGRVALTMPATDYDGLCDAMFHTIRQNAAGSPYVLIRLLEVLARVAEVERQAVRRAALRRHGDLVMALAGDVQEAASRVDLRHRHEVLIGILDKGGRVAGLCEPDTATG